MSRSRRCIATDAALLVAGLCFAAAASAAPAGAVSQLSGALLVHKPDGRTQIVAIGSPVEAGDTLVTGSDAYAEVRFADRSSVILQPDTHLAVEAFTYVEARAQDDRATLALTQGGLQVTSGAIAARSPGRHTLVTALGSITVTRSKFVVKFPAPATVAMNARIHLASLATGTLSDVGMPALVIAQAPSLPATPGGGLAPGLYVNVVAGAITVTNNGGSQSFAAGQFGYTANFNAPPVIIPNNPGLKFTPPPTFSSNSGQQGGSGSNKSNTVDCEVR